MLATNILSNQAIKLDDTSSSKKRVLEQAAHLLNPQSSIEQTEAIFERLLERERLGSTGLAGGVALPHARMPGIDSTRGAFIRLASPIDFDSLDDQPTDLIFALLVPEEATDEHLKILAELARLFHEESVRDQLRQASEIQQILNLLTKQSAHHAA